MNLSTLVAMTRADLYEEGRTPLADTLMYEYVNAAMWHVANLATGADNTLMALEDDVQLSFAVGDDPLVPVTLGTPTTLHKVRAVISARRLKAPAYTDPALPIVRFGDFIQRVIDQSADLPFVTVMHETIYVLNPPDGISIRFDYLPVLPRMTLANDTPGQGGTVGIVNLMPEPWQELIHQYATILILSRENISTATWRTAFEEQLTALASGATLEGRATQRT